MKSQAPLAAAPIVRTDFSDDSAWAAVCAAIAEHVGDDTDGPDCVDDPEYDGMTAEQLVAFGQEDKDCLYAFVADRRTMTDPEMPILVVDLDHEPGRTFRTVPSELASIADRDFAEFADGVDADGVFRGFR